MHKFISIVTKRKIKIISHCVFFLLQFALHDLLTSGIRAEKWEKRVKLNNVQTFLEAKLLT